MRKYKWGLIIAAVFLAVTAYFAYLHTCMVKTCYMDEKIVLGERQFIVQKIEARNFKSNLLGYSKKWYFNIAEKLPSSWQPAFLKVCSFYSRPGITYQDTWEVKVEGVIIPRMDHSYHYLDYYIDGHSRGNGFRQSQNCDYTFFHIRGDYFSAADLNQAMNLIFKDNHIADKTAIEIMPQWENKYYFMGLPDNLAADPADTTRKFLALIARDKKRDALKLVAEEKRNGLAWAPYEQILKQMNPADILNYSLERIEQAGGYPVVYALGVKDRRHGFRMNLIKRQDSYEIVDLIVETGD